MTLRDDLISDDDELRARAFEELMLDAFDIRESDLPLNQLASVYERISRRLAQESAEGAVNSRILTRRAAPLTGQWSALVWALIYGARTFHIAHRLLGAFPPRPGRFMELGSGFGPFALRASLCPEVQGVMLVDRELPATEFERRLYGRVGAQPPEMRHDDLRSCRADGAASVAVPFALREVGGDAALVERWLRDLGPNGRLYLVEPGTRPIARVLQGIRDKLQPRRAIAGPCQGAVRCPRLRDGRDWCHFTWRVPLGPLGRRVADLARRRWTEIHVAWLVVDAEIPVSCSRSKNSEARQDVCASGDPPPERANMSGVVLEVRPRRHEVEARICTVTGREMRLTALRRSRSIHRQVEGLEPGDTVTVEGWGTQEVGSGTRLVDEDALRITRSIRAQKPGI